MEKAFLEEGGPGEELLRLFFSNLKFAKSE